MTSARRRAEEIYDRLRFDSFETSELDDTHNKGLLERVITEAEAEGYKRGRAEMNEEAADVAFNACDCPQSSCHCSAKAVMKIRALLKEKE
jgi:hypothetical protein